MLILGEPENWEWNTLYLYMNIGLEFLLISCDFSGRRWPGMKIGGGQRPPPNSQETTAEQL